MAAITVAEYQDIAEYYTNALSYLTGISAYFLSAAQVIVDSDDFDPNLDLLRPFYDAYTGSELVYQSTPVGVVQAVAALQAHVLSKARTKTPLPAGSGTFSDINDWLVGTGGRYGDITDAAITVSGTFADISDAAGYAIDGTNITPGT